MAGETPSCKLWQLPLEIWTMIMSFVIADNPAAIVHAWLTFRPLCRQFKKATELAFKTSHLRQTVVDFHGSMHISENSIGTAWLKFQFVRMSEDGERIIFKYTGPQDDTAIQILTIDGDPQPASGTYDTFMRGWKKKLRRFITASSGVNLRAPPYVILLANIAINTTQLTGLQVNFESMEMSALWRPTLTKLFTEEYDIRKGLLRIRKNSTAPPFELMSPYQAEQTARRSARLLRYPPYRRKLVALIIGSNYLDEPFDLKISILRDELGMIRRTSA